MLTARTGSLRDAILLCALVLACGCGGDDSSGANDGFKPGGNGTGSVQGGTGGGASGGTQGGTGGNNQGGTGGSAVDPGGGNCGGASYTAYPDTDGDGFGVAQGATQVCVGSAAPAGTALGAGDECYPDDMARNDGEIVCGDNVDDDCESGDEVCPTTMAAGIDQPAWNCRDGSPPANVYGWVLYEDTGGYFQPNPCVIFFEGLKDEFYSQWAGLSPPAGKTGCDTYDGCVCPSSPSYDRRLYAFTKSDASGAACAQIMLQDHGGNDQPVSNDCRKYLTALHGSGAVSAIAPDGQPAFEIPFSYMGSNILTLERRLAEFPNVEVACTNVSVLGANSWVTLMEKPVMLNTAFVKK